MNTSDGLAFVWEESGKILAFACAHDLGFRAYLSEFIVASSVREQGVGKQLLQYIEKILLARGCTIFIADVWKDAVPFYSRSGWFQPDVILMRKKLT
jgi:GNAT superfamily N-acetyltransferase